MPNQKTASTKPGVTIKYELINIQKRFQVVRRSDKDSKPGIKTISKGNEETRSVKSNESDTNVGKPERKYSDFRSRIVEEKQRKTFYKRDTDDSKITKTNTGNRKGVPDEKGDNYSIGNCPEVKDNAKKSETESEGKRHDFKVELKETKSKFRYSEQRNRDREYRQKTSDCKNSKEIQGCNAELKSKAKEPEEKATNKVSNLSQEEVKKSSSEPQVVDGSKTLSIGKIDIESISLPSRRKSLETEREMVDTERKRSKSFHDISSKEFCGFDAIKKKERRDTNKARDMNTPDKESVHADDNSKESTESDKVDDESKKDPRAERRIRNKVREERND